MFVVIKAKLIGNMCKKDWARRHEFCWLPKVCSIRILQAKPTLIADSYMSDLVNFFPGWKLKHQACTGLLNYEMIATA